MWYFCTAGRGTEVFVERELQQKLRIPCDQISKTDGKVFFLSDPSDYGKICDLKTVERVFAQVVHIKSKDATDNLHSYNGIVKAVCGSQEWFSTDLTAVIETLKNENTEDAGPPPNKKQCSDQQTSFRICCKCAGKVGRHIQSQNLSRQVGVALSKHLNWVIDLRRPSIEVNIHLNDDGLIVGIPLKRVPLSKRSYIKHFGLRATVAWIIGDLINAKNGEIVLDPMCGKATILLEMAKANPSVQCVGIDRDEQQLMFASENVKFAGVTNQIQLIQADSTIMLIKDSSIDDVVCDAPFGKKFEVSEEIKIFYGKLFQQVNRVLQPGGTFVLLTSSDIHRHLSKIYLKPSDNSTIDSERHIKESHSNVDKDLPKEAVDLDRQCGSIVIDETNKNIARKLDKDDNIKTDSVESDTFQSDKSDINTNYSSKDHDHQSQLDKGEMNAVIGSTNSDLETGKSGTDLDFGYLKFVDSYYIKLGETDSYICTFIK